MSNETLQETVSYRYPTTVSVVHTEHGDTITIHHAKTPAEAAELVRMTKQQLLSRKITKETHDATEYGSR